MTTPSEKIFTTRTLAKAWNCSDQHIRNLIRSGELKAYRFGKKVFRIRAGDLEDYLCRSIVLSNIAASTTSPTRASEELSAARLARLSLQMSKSLA